MIIYGPSLSPFVRKVLAFAAEKGIEVENVAQHHVDPGFALASPFRKIPALKDGDFLISDSSAIVAYMEKLKPDPAMLPEDPKAYARTVWYDEYADTILASASIPIFFNRIVANMLGRPCDEAVASKAEKEQLPPCIDYLETVIPASGFLVEDRITLADIAVGSLFANLEHLGLSPDPKVYPKTAAYAAGILARPSFSRLVGAEKAMLSGQAA